MAWHKVRSETKCCLVSRLTAVAGKEGGGVMRRDRGNRMKPELQNSL